MAVSHAIKQGRLRQSVTVDSKGVPRINSFELADKEWAAYSDPPKYIPASPPIRANDDEDLGAMAAARLRKEQAVAALKEMDLQTKAGALVEAAGVERRLAEVFGECRTRLLGVPSRARQALPHLTAADLLVLEGLIRETLEGLAS